MFECGLYTYAVTFSLRVKRKTVVQAVSKRIVSCGLRNDKASGSFFLFIVDSVSVPLLALTVSIWQQEGHPTVISVSSVLKGSHLGTRWLVPSFQPGVTRGKDDRLEDKRENYQVCSVQYCAQQLLCTVQCTHI